MSADLVAFLRERLDEEQSAAEAATPGPWWYNPGKQWLGPDAFERYDQTQGEEFVGYGGPHPFTGAVAATGPANNPQSMADAAFIARRDPVRVLAEVAAKQQLLVVCETAKRNADLPDPEGGYPPAMFVNGYASALDHAVRLSALPYADHPGYRPEWAPDA